MQYLQKSCDVELEWYTALSIQKFVLILQITTNCLSNTIQQKYKSKYSSILFFCIKSDIKFSHIMFSTNNNLGITV